MANGLFKATGPGMATISMTDPWLPTAPASAIVTVDSVPPSITVTVRGTVAIGNGGEDCGGVFVERRGNLGGLPFTALYRLDPLRGSATTTETYARVTNTNLGNTIGASPITAAALTIAGRTINFDQLGATRVSAVVAVSTDGIIPAGPSLNVLYNYALLDGPGAFGNITIGIADPVFADMLGNPPDVGRPYTYTYDASSAPPRSSASFLVIDPPGGVNGCGGRAAYGQLLVDSISVSR
jgi:hypothetical protein